MQGRFHLPCEPTSSTLSLSLSLKGLKGAGKRVVARVEAASRLEAIGQYWDHYHLEIQRLLQRYPARVRKYTTTQLLGPHSGEVQRELLSWLGANAPKLFKTAVQHNAGPAGRSGKVGAQVGWSPWCGKPTEHVGELGRWLRWVGLCGLPFAVVAVSVEDVATPREERASPAANRNARKKDNRASPPHRPREDGLAHPADTQ